MVLGDRHHDGFQIYDSALPEWNAVRMGPKRDIIGELASDAARFVTGIVVPVDGGFSASSGI